MPNHRRSRKSITPTEHLPIARLLWPQHVADITGLEVSTLAQMRYTGTGPKFVKLGHQVRYRVEDVEKWIADRTKSSTAKAVR